MPDFREIMAAERAADDSAKSAWAVAGEQGAYVEVLLMLDAIRLEIRAQGMRFDHSITEASRA